jgi:hypothetical protein
VKVNLAVTSLLLFGLSVALSILLTRFEAGLVGFSPGFERVISLLGLVLPAGIGVVLGVMSLLRKEGQRRLALSGITFNALFGFFHLMVILFAG